MSAQPIVVGYHDRPPSREALEWAAEEASHRVLPLVVLFAANYPGMLLPAGADAAVWAPEPGALEAANEVTVRGVAEATVAYPDIDVQGRTEVTSPAQALVEASAEAAMVVIGSRGRNPVLGALLGSVSLVVAAQARCPVIVVKPGAATIRPNSDREVVVGTDGSAAASSAVLFAAETAAARFARLCIICCTGDAAQAGFHPADARETASGILVAQSRAVAAAFPELAVETRVEERAADEALVAASEDAGMIVVGSRGRGAFRGLIGGSVSMAVVHGARCAVAVIGPPPQGSIRPARIA